MFKRSDFSLKMEIGRGAFGRVYISDHRKSGLELAVKAVPKSEINTKYQGQLTIREKKLFEKIINPSQNQFIVHLYGIFQNNKYILSVYELCKGGDLGDLISHEGRLSENEIRFYDGSIVLAVEFLHKNNIVHRDLKPQNVLLDSSGYIKLTDFGFAQLSFRKAIKSAVGTPGYCAPEIYQHQNYTNSVDWWSLGAIIHKMLTGQVPFEDELEIAPGEDHEAFLDKLIQVTLEIPFSISSRYPSKVRYLLHDCLEKCPSKRLSNSADVKEKGYFHGFDWIALQNHQLSPPFPNPRYGKLYRKGTRNGRNIDDLHGVKLNLPRCSEPDKCTKVWQVEAFRKDLNFVSDQWKDKMMLENLAKMNNNESSKKALVFHQYETRFQKNKLLESQQQQQQQNENENCADETVVVDSTHYLPSP